MPQGCCFTCLELLSFSYCVEVFLHATGEDELYIGLRFVIDQEVQFAAVEPRLGKLIFHGDTVNSEMTTIGKNSLYSVSIEIKVTFIKEHY